MKPNLSVICAALFACAATCAPASSKAASDAAQPGASVAQAASFTYHGNLTDAGQPANGRYDLRVSVYGSEQGTVPLVPTVTLYGVEVHEGSFNADLDLGDAARQGGWVGVAVRPAGSGEFAALSGRSQMAPEGTCPAAWLLGGNPDLPAGSYLGTNGVDLEFQTGFGVDIARFVAAGHSVILSPRLGGSPTAGANSTSVSASFPALGDYSFAGGNTGATAFEGSFVWGDMVSGIYTDTAPNQFIVKADGGFILNGSGLNTPQTDDMVIYPRPNGDNGSDLKLVSRNFHWGHIWVSDFSGILYLQADGGVHVEGPVGIEGALKTASIQVQGSASKSTAGAWKANSDLRIKQDIELVSDAIDTLLKVHPVTFEYTDTYRRTHPGVTNQRYYNVVAQEFAEVFPDAVTGSGEYLADAPRTPDNEILQVDTYPAQIVTIAAVQELAQRNADLQDTVERLLARIEKLEAARGK